MLLILKCAACDIGGAVAFHVACFWLWWIGVALEILRPKLQDWISFLGYVRVLFKCLAIKDELNLVPLTDFSISQGTFGGD